jgi:colicin import membrane protein
MNVNNNKSASPASPLATLQQLESELYALREKQIAVLEKELLAIESKEDSLKKQADKTRLQLNQAKDKLKDQSAAKPSIQKRHQDSVDKALLHFEQLQSELAQLRGTLIAQRLEIRKDKAVLKAMLDTKKALKKDNKPATPARSSAARPAPKAAAPAKAVAPKVTAAKAKAAAPKAKAKAPAPKTKAAAPKAKAQVAEKAKAEPKPNPAISPEEKLFAAPKRRVRRMSDIPSHPDKLGDRLASLFDDF